MVLCVVRMDVFVLRWFGTVWEGEDGGNGEMYGRNSDYDRTT